MAQKQPLHLSDNGEGKTFHFHNPAPPYTSYKYPDIDHPDDPPLPYETPINPDSVFYDPDFKGGKDILKYKNYYPERKNDKLNYIDIKNSSSKGILEGEENEQQSGKRHLQQT